MFLLQRTRDNPDDQEPTARDVQTFTAARRIPRGRVGVVWISICAAPVMLAGLITFIVQNTDSVKVSFLGLGGTLPLAMALFLAMLSGTAVTLAIGAAFATRRRHLARKHAD
ncbi:lipopolysaccharide assembly protein LapA domain-containing protein [Actinomadura sp. HBU206391]|uniref:lipopolysaccharide assembly protein LapA domain-containing protein n=1 Tax=Actinomadura sp. HBU206391 TaxID=2731692 RepID=UPI00164FC15D|nr:lipopolysaccharide assembly protein LapA domain-containing protein [Actinomadura sp. HBU206391]MBC6457376.1 DUF1049 domain-containing protein [Actinomadura sp. HBU206391]